MASSKTKMARKMLSHQELIDGVSIFNSRAWNKRKKAARERVLRREERSKKK